VDKKIKLSVLGFSYNQTQSGTYGLVLAEEKGLRRLMILVGAPEAQSIAFKLHESSPPRPLTHDLIQLLINEFDILLEEVVIYKYEDGVFFSKLYLNGPDNKFTTIESRTSDAIAIALRTHSPIYTTETIMQELAVVVEEDANEPESDDIITEVSDDIQDRPNYSLYNKDELEIMLDDAIAGEDYELASVLRDEIRKKEDLL